MRGAPIVAMVLLLQTPPPRTDAALPVESAGWDAVLDGLVSVFDRADLLMLGEAHGRAADAELRLRLIRHPAFAEKVRFIVLETIAADRQPLLDRFVSGGELSQPERQALDASNFEPLLDAIRALNADLLPSRQLRVIASGIAAVRPDERQAAAADLIESEVLERRGKALVVFGSGHVWHGAGGLTRRLQAMIPGRVFVAEAIVDAGVEPDGRLSASDVADARRALAALRAAVQSGEGPVLVALPRSPAGALPANPFYSGQAMLPDATTLADIDDAVIYFDRAAAGRVQSSGRAFRREGPNAVLN